MMNEAVIIGGYALIGSMTFVVLLGLIAAVTLNYCESKAVRDESH